MMIGPPKPRLLGAPIAVSLEDLVPPNNFYRHLEARLDLSFVRDWTRELYAERGRPSIDPVVFFKLQLVMFFEGSRSERQIMQAVADRLGLRWVPRLRPDRISCEACRAPKADLAIHPKADGGAPFLTKFGLPIGPRSIENVVAKYSALAGIAGASPHALRHTFAT